MRDLATGKGAEQRRRQSGEVPIFKMGNVTHFLEQTAQKWIKGEQMLYDRANSFMKKLT